MELLPLGGMLVSWTLINCDHHGSDGSVGQQWLLEFTSVIAHLELLKLLIIGQSN